MCDGSFNPALKLDSTTIITAAGQEIPECKYIEWLFLKGCRSLLDFYFMEIIKIFMNFMSVTRLFPLDVDTLCSRCSETNISNTF